MASNRWTRPVPLIAFARPWSAPSSLSTVAAVASLLGIAVGIHFQPLVCRLASAVMAFALAPTSPALALGFSLGASLCPSFPATPSAARAPKGAAKHPEAATAGELHDKFVQEGDSFTMSCARRRIPNPQPLAQTHNPCSSAQSEARLKARAR